jgi:hypothetical protein
MTASVSLPLHPPLRRHLVRLPLPLQLTLTPYTNRYRAIGLHPGANAFFRFLVYLFLGVLAAEFRSLLIASIVPIFVAALALASFLNGFWMVRYSLDSTVRGFDVWSAGL